jgi:hypothetical protein
MGFNVIFQLIEMWFLSRRRISKNNVAFCFCIPNSPFTKSNEYFGMTMRNFLENSITSAKSMKNSPTYYLLFQNIFDLFYVYFQMHSRFLEDPLFACFCVLNKLELCQITFSHDSLQRIMNRIELIETYSSKGFPSWLDIRNGEKFALFLLLSVNNISEN